MATNYIILDTADKKDSVPTERPETIGSKRYLKKKNNGIHGMCASMLEFMVNDWNSNFNTDEVFFNNKTKKHFRSSPIAEIRLNFDYYLAQQMNLQFQYLAEYDGKGGEVAAPWTNGHEIYNTVRHMVGPIEKHFAATTITVESLDPSVQSIKQGRIAMLEAKKKMPAVFKMLSQAGVEFMPEGAEGVDIDTAIQEVLRKPSHKIEEYGMDLLTFINNVNSIKDLMPKMYRNMVIGKWCSVHVDSSEARINVEGIRSDNVIWDRSNEDDDYNRYSLYKGFISWKTEEEIAQAYQLGEDALKELKGMFTKNSSAASVIMGAVSDNYIDNSFNWTETGRIRRVACVTGYFVVTITGEGDETYNTLYQGTLIGNKILVNYGESNNISYDMARPEWPIAPIFIYSPDTIMGRNVCPVDRFRQMQADCDAYLFKIREKISRDLGKTYVMWAEAIGGDNLDAAQVIGELKREGLTVLSRSDGEEPIVNGKPVEMIDMSLDPNLITYVNLRKEMIQDMRNVVSQTNITTGMQQSYIGGGTQQKTIEQASNATVGLMQGFFQYFAFIEQYMLNTAKVMLLDAKNEDEAELVFSEASKNFWREIQNIPVEDLQVRVEMEDFIDDQMKVELNSMSLAWSQNFKDTGFGPVEWLETKRARTTTELMRRMKETFEKKEMKANRERKEQMAFEAAENQKAREFQAQMEQMNNQASAGRDMIREAPKHEANQIKREELNLDREMSMKSEEGIPYGG